MSSRIAPKLASDPWLKANSSDSCLLSTGTASRSWVRKSANRASPMDRCQISSNSSRRDGFPVASTTARWMDMFASRIEQPGGILIEIPTFILEDYQHVFAVRQQEVEEGGLSVERVGQRQIECAWITHQRSL